MSKKIRMELPNISELEKIRVILDEPRNVVFKDRRKLNKPMISYTPIDFEEKYRNRKGVYIIIRNENEIIHVGSTENLANRIRSHKCLTENRDIKFIYFLEVNNKHDRLLFEMVYKYHFFGKGKGMIDYYARFG